MAYPCAGGCQAVEVSNPRLRCAACRKRLREEKAQLEAAGDNIEAEVPRGRAPGLGRSISVLKRLVRVHLTRLERRMFQVDKQTRRPINRSFDAELTVEQERIAKLLRDLEVTERHYTEAKKEKAAKMSAADRAVAMRDWVAKQDAGLRAELLAGVFEDMDEGAQLALLQRLTRVVNERRAV